MTRALPLSQTQPTEPSSVGTTTEGSTFSGTVEVFDPAMCCPTGVCGPGVDPALLQIARDLRWLTARGVMVQRTGLAQEPAAFAANATVAALMHSKGDAALPAVLVNGEVLCHGRYPGRAEIEAALSGVAKGAPEPDTRAPHEPLPLASDPGCCTPGTGCC